MKSIVTFAAIILLCFVNLKADDLYHVKIKSHDDANLLSSISVEPVTHTADGYLILIQTEQSVKLKSSGLELEFLSSGLTKSDLYLDIDHDRNKRPSFPIVYQEEGLRLFIIPAGTSLRDTDQVAPILTPHIKIEYRPTSKYNPRAMTELLGLDSLISLVNQDSLESYVTRLQAFYRRQAGTDSCFAASDWIKQKFESFGYDSVVFDSFMFQDYEGWSQGRNVIATKVGTTQPEWEIVIGAHHDAVRTSPGADDNGSGTAGVLEIARVLKDLDIPVTFKFMTFDAEERGLYGSWHYSNAAAANEDRITLMLNMDMIGHYENQDTAAVYHGDDWTYSQLWSDLADSLVGIVGLVLPSYAGSDHHPFEENGFNITNIHEWIFSSVYHSNQDSTTYMNFEYMTKLVAVSAATTYSVAFQPPSAIITAVIDGGDGQSLLVKSVSMDPTIIDHSYLYYAINGFSTYDSIYVPNGQSDILLTGLSEGNEYEIFILPYNSSGVSALSYQSAYGRPYSIPSRLSGLTAVPLYEGIELDWAPNPELDMSHYRIVRDGSLLPDIIVGESAFTDLDLALGGSFHDYVVFAVDVDNNISDTVSIPPVSSRAATLEEGRILAVNRSHISTGQFLVDEQITGDFLREALSVFDLDYFSDSAHSDNDEDKVAQLEMFDLLDYELIVIGAESGRLDDIGNMSSGGIIDYLEFYLSLGGKVIIFGRWGEVDFSTDYYYDASSPGYLYNSIFDIEIRHLVLTSSSGSELSSDMIGAHSLLPGYPDLSWDSSVAVSHSFPYTDLSGIPCLSYPTLSGSDYELIYSYNGSDNGAITEGQPIAWRSTDPERQYTYFEFPLSFIDRSQASVALAKAVLDYGFIGATTVAAPDSCDIWAGLDDSVSLYLGNLAGNRSASEIDQSSILINGTLVPGSVIYEPSHPDFSGDLLNIKISSTQLAQSYADLVCNHNLTFDLAWNFNGESETNLISAPMTVLGYKAGDANTDGSANVGDAVFLIGFVFGGGDSPFPYLSGDANCDATPNVGDAVYLINFVFKGGEAPCCLEK